MSGSGSSGIGQQTPGDSASDFNVISFIVRQMMGRMATMRLVQVKAVTSNGEVAAAGTVNVQPLVNQVDGGGNATEQGIVNGIPWWRLQGGKNAVICDPVVGDIGYVDVSDRDISSVVKTRAAANPGSARWFSLSDGVYVGGVINVAPTCYILFKADGHLKIVDTDGNVVETSSSGFKFTGNMAVTGTITATGEITRGLGTGDQVTLGHHTHTQPVDSHGDTEAPTNAPTAGT